jgi:hypothetical protein
MSAARQEGIAKLLPINVEFVVDLKSMSLDEIYQKRC